jgi:hypothetical protein
MKFWQQGDCLLKPATIPADATEHPGNELVRGSAGGNTHRAIGPALSLLKSGDTLYVRAVEPFEVRHEEHKAFMVPAGEYVVEGVREYDHIAEEARRVVD